MVRRRTQNRRPRWAWIIFIRKAKVSKYCCLTKCQSEHYLLLLPMESVWLEISYRIRPIFLLFIVAERLWTVNFNDSLQDTHSPQREQHGSSQEYWTIPGLSHCGNTQGLWTQGKQQAFSLQYTCTDISYTLTFTLRVYIHVTLS